MVIYYNESGAIIGDGDRNSWDPLAFEQAYLRVARERRKAKRSGGNESGEEAPRK